MKKTPSKSQIFLAQLVLALMIGFVVIGVVLYGLSVPVFERIWHNLLERPSGPLTFRFYLQPTMAAIAALLDGLGDARAGRTPYFWTIVTDPAKRVARLNEGLIATARVLLLGLGMDLIYQYVVSDTFHPAEAVIVAVLLAFVPYLVMRGTVTRIARRWFGDATPKDAP